MAKHFEKFIFLGVVISLAFFARAAYPSSAPKPQTSIIEANPPLLVLSSPSIPPSSQSPSLEGFGDPVSGTQGNATQSAPASAQSAFVRKGNTAAPVVSETAYLVADPETGAIFSGDSVNKRWPTASITKLMTATVAIDNVDPNAHISISPEIFAADPEETTLVPGGTYSMADLMHVMLMPSSNVAAEALASYFGKARFLAFMNERAQTWGMKNTYFDDPSGISSANESTVSDMLILAQHVYNDYPQVYAITRTAATTITEINSTRKISVKSINNFAGQADFIGGKTGHTNEAGGNLLSIFRYDGHPVLIVVLGSDDRFGATTALYAWFKQNFQ